MFKKKKKAPFGGLKIWPDKALAEIVGKAAVTPAEMTKKIWQYIKKKKLLKR
jgi:chromatin remodeling complex protein RSC6